MARQSGVDYWPKSVDMFYDEKIHAIIMEVTGGRPRSMEGRAARALIDDLLSYIYSRGYAVELSTPMREELAFHEGMEIAELEGFIGTCAKHGFFDAALWEQGVLTGRGVQKRYMEIKKRSVLSGPYVLDSPETCEISRNPPKSSETCEISRNPPKSSAEEEEERELKEKGKEKTDTDACGMAGALPCLAVPAEGMAVFIDLAKKPHRTALGAIAASCAAVSSADPAAFIGKLAGRCPPSCRGDPAHAEECYQLVMRGLGKFDPAKGRDPWPLVAKIVDEERGRA